MAATPQQTTEKDMTERDLVLIMKVARIGLSMVADEIAEELGISFAELDRIRDLVVDN